MSDHYCCKRCGQQYNKCECQPLQVKGGKITLPTRKANMDEVLFGKMVREVVLTAFDHATAAFRENPHGDNWKNLEDAMWARQALGSKTVVNNISTLENIGVGNWITTLRGMHEGKAK